MKRLLLFILGFLLLFPVISVAKANNLKDSIVKINAVVQPYDYFAPWQKENPKIVSLFGCILKDNLILTLAHPLQNHIMIEVSKKGQSKRYPASVLVKDYEVNLALLSVSDKKFFQNLEPVILASQFLEEKDGMILKWDRQGILQKYTTKFLGTKIEYYATKSPLLTYYMSTDLDSSSSGAPVFRKGGDLIGLVRWFEAKKSTIKIIPAVIIRKLLKNFTEKKYEGFASFWWYYTSLEHNQYLKEYLGIPTTQGGVYIDKISTGATGFDELKVGDVLISIDNKKIDDDGNIQLLEFGKVNFAAVLNMNYSIGDNVPVEVIRDKKKILPV